MPSAIGSSFLRRARADERVVHVALVIPNGALHTLDGLVGGAPLPTPALPRRTTNAYRMANRYDRPEVEHEWHDASWQDAPGEILPGCDDARYIESQEGRQARGLCRSHARYQPRPRHSSASLPPAWQERQVRELMDDLTGKFLDSHEPGHSRHEVEGYGHYFLGSIVISHKRGQRYTRNSSSDSRRGSPATSS